MPSIPDKKWFIEPIEQGEKIAGVPSLICSLLAQRGVSGREAVEKFLNPSLEQLPAPTGMAGLEEAVAILAQGVVERRQVLIYGDYDADGITSTALLLSFFKEIGLACSWYIPDRTTEGYGLNIGALQKLRAGLNKADSPEPLLITVDCGISSHVEVAEARRLGFKVIITDHHRPPAELPEAEAIINPHRKDCTFPEKNLAGVGVAFYLLIGLRTRLTELGYWSGGRQPNLKRYLDLVAIGTIADLVPLTGANRVMVKAGLGVLSNNPRPGLQAILKNAGITDLPITADQIAFQVAPRINAAGRVARAGLALEVLLAENQGDAAEPAKLLEKANNHRKELSEEIFGQACGQAEIRLEEGGASLVLADETWHVGVVGLIASRIAERYHRPTVVLSCDEEGLARGSARSVGKLDLLERIEECAELLEKYGGHKGAAGLTIRSDRIEAFAEQFEASVDRIMKGADPQPTIYVNLRASVSELMNRHFLEFFEKLEPFGNGNPEPVFCSRQENCSLKELQKVGKNSLRFRVNDNGALIKGIAFGMADLLPIIKDVPISLAYKIFKNKFRGQTNWEIRAEDIKLIE